VVDTVLFIETCFINQPGLKVQFSAPSLRPHSPSMQREEVHHLFFGAPHFVASGCLHPIEPCLGKHPSKAMADSNV